MGIKKSLALVLGASALSYGMVKLLEPIDALEKKFSQEVPSYVDKNLSSIISNQEKILNIEYPQNLAIEYYVQEEDSLGIIEEGFYLNDTIYINLSHTVAKDQNWITRALCNTYNSSDVKEIINHELGHYYIDLVSQKKLGRRWLTCANEGKYVFLSKSLIEEGICEYFRNKSNGVPIVLDNNWPKKEDFESNDLLVYDIGPKVVAPIIDTYGNKGIEFMLQNIPSE
ncbi:MAG TPA: hypothetical protein VEC16_04015, partial [Alphaproteobacteria bacterium]|nr:hypothetical protein [Alphaproteobacteria bacterium]